MESSATDPTALYRLRDGIYAADLLVVAVAEPDLFYSVLLMQSTPGRCWSVGELGAMLAEAGFTGITHRPTAGDRTALVARKPA